MYREEKNKTKRAVNKLKIAIPIITMAVMALVTYLYCLYITGRTINMKTYIAFTTCSLPSIGIDGYFHKITIRIDKSALYYGNTRLRGILQISIVTPYGVHVWTYRIENQRTLCIDVSEAVKEFQKYYTYLKIENTYEKGDMPLPTVWFTFYMYDRHGHIYLGSYGYDTLTLLFTMTKNYIESAKEALSDPLRIFRQPLLIIADKDDVMYINMTDIVRNAVEKYVEDRYGVTLRKLILRSRIMKLRQVSTCSDVLMVTPGSSSKFHIYLYPTDMYDPYRAILCTFRFINYSDGINVVTALRNPEIVSGNVTLGLYLKCSTVMPLESCSCVTEPLFDKYTSGMAFLGFIVLGHDKLHRENWITKIYCDTCKYPWTFLSVPFKLYKIGLASFVLCYVEKLGIDGHRYWVVVPLESEIPLYYVALFNLSGARIVNGNSLDLSDLIGKVSLNLIYKGTTAPVMEPEKIFFYFTTDEEHINNTALAGIAIPLSLVDASAGGLSGDLFYIVYSNAGFPGIDYRVDIHTLSSIKRRLNLLVYGISVRYLSHYIVKDCEMYVPSSILVADVR
ncbi:MAG: hypothetical protein GXO23_06915 [Crenarchaeota archaeon]|nr:hypothetical protein [Thermoproteota archaeon]